MSTRLERDLAEIVEIVLADPKLTQAEAEFLASIPDLFKAPRDEFEAAAAIIEKSLERRGWNRTTDAQGILVRSFETLGSTFGE